MEKRIENVFDYGSYRQLLTDDFAKRVAFNNSYSLRAYAGDIGVSPGYLSKIFNNKKELSRYTGRKIFTQLGFADQELSYIEDMIEFNTTNDVGAKLDLQQRLRSYNERTNLHSSFETVPMVSSVNSFMVYALVRDLNDVNEIYSVTDEFNISRDDVLKALDLFIKEGYVRLEDERYYVTEKDFQIVQDHENFCGFAFDLANFFHNHYKEKNISRNPDYSSSNLVLGFDESQLKEVHELHHHFIMHLFKISERCKKPSTYVFLSNLYLEKKVKKTPLN